MFPFVKRIIFGSTTESDTGEFMYDEDLEEYRMVSCLDPEEILRLYAIFRSKVGKNEKNMSKDVFLKMECIAMNPLKERICMIFGYDSSSTIDFKQFVCGIAEFNSPSPASREQKLRVAFRLHDMDNDGFISKDDLEKYLGIVTADSLAEAEIKDIVQSVFVECCSDPKQHLINFSDFQRVIAPTDFHIKLHLPI